MKHNMHLNAADYLAFHLYATGNSPAVKASRRRNRLFMVGMLLVLSVFWYFNDNLPLTVLALLIAVPVFIYYRKYDAWVIKNRLGKHVRRNFSASFGQTITMEFGADRIQVVNGEGETSIVYKEIEEINEIKTHYFFKMEDGQGFLVSKASLSEPDAFEEQLNKVVNDNEIYHSVDMEWKWT